MALPPTKLTHLNITPTGMVTFPGPLTAWTNASDALASNNQYAYAALGFLGITTDLRCTYDGASGRMLRLPDNATIEGLMVDIEWHDAVAAEASKCVKMQFAYGGGDIGDDKADNELLPAADAHQQYGDADDRWTWAPTPAKLKDASFSLNTQCATASGVSSEPSVDHVQLSVYYHTPPMRHRTRRMRRLPSSHYTWN